MLITGLAGILFSGLGIYFQWPIQGIFQLHLGSALLFILGVALHFFNRKNKAVKIVQQFNLSKLTENLLDEFGGEKVRLG